MRDWIKLVMVGLTFLLWIGCASVEKGAFQAVGAAGITVNAALGAYIEWMQTHPPSQEEVEKVRTLVKQYLKGVEKVRSVVNLYKAGLATKEELQNALASLQGDQLRLNQTLEEVMR